MVDIRGIILYNKKMKAKKLLLINCYREDREVKITGYLAWLNAVAAASNQALQVMAAADDAPLPATGDFSGVIVSGSQKMVGDGEVEAGLLEFLKNNRRPLLGICYGHQVLAAAFNGLVRRDGRAHKGDEDVLIKKAAGLFAGFPLVCKMRQSHEEIVVRDRALDENFLVLAQSGSGRVEGIAHRQQPFFGVQFHPEKSGEMGAKLLANFLQLIKN
jgi:GMP synthase-like glutamine amidotransferase